jgi:hypothetical protein
MSGGSSSLGGSTSTGGSTSLGGSTGTGGSSSLGGSTGTGGSGPGGTSAGGGAAVGGSAGSSGAATGGSAGSPATGGAGGGGAAGAAGAGGGSGTCVGAGHALSLMGNTSTGPDPARQNAYADLGSDLPLGSSARTLETWAYMTNQEWAGNVNTLFFYGVANNGSAPAFGFDFGVTTNGQGTIDPFTNGIFDNDNQPSGVTAATSQWVHFAMVWDPTANAVLAYVNGVLKATKTSTDTAHPMINTLRSVLTIGGYPDPDNNFFSSYIDEFQVWNVARSAADIRATMGKTLTGTEPGLVGYWQFNEASGTVAADSVKTAGHTPHPATLIAGNVSATGQVTPTGMAAPTFAIPNPPTPVTCP